MKKIAALIALALATLLAGTACEIEDPAAQGAGQEAEQAAEQDTKAAKATKKAESVPVKVAGKAAQHTPGPLSSGSPHTCVKATVTNQTKGRLDINPLYFAITDTGGTKRAAVVGEAEDEFELMALAPREKATGIVCAKGRFTADAITFTKDGFGTNYRGKVAS